MGLLMTLAMAALEFTPTPDAVQPSFELLRWSELHLIVGTYWRGYAVVQSTGFIRAFDGRNFRRDFRAPRLLASALGTCSICEGKYLEHCRKYAMEPAFS